MKENLCYHNIQVLIWKNMEAQFIKPFPEVGYISTTLNPFNPSKFTEETKESYEDYI